MSSRITGMQPPMTQPDEMCPNCCTPWKCNGPHLTWAGDERGMSPQCGMCGERGGFRVEGQAAIVCFDCARAVCAMVNAAAGGQRSEVYCAICDGDALPAAVRLKGGGFVCEGCVVLEYPSEKAER